MAETRTSILVIYPASAHAFAEAARDAFERAGCTVDLNDEELLDVNDQFLETTLNRSGYYDFCIAILVDGSGTAGSAGSGTAGADELFEFGLFVGRLGPRRAFPLVQAGFEALRDWQGISFETFDASREPGEAVAAGCERLVSQMRHAEAEASLPMLPSTALAIGYYRNFLEPVLLGLTTTTSVRVQERDRATVVSETTLGLDLDQLVINVRVPRDLRDLTRRGINARTEPYKQVIVETSARSFPFYLDAELGETADGVALVDFPTTLLSASYALELLFSPDFLARRGGEVRQRLEDREIGNFEATLRRLAPDDAEERYFRFTVVE